MGFKSKLIETRGNFSVFGERVVSKEKPTILIYGHYDVQPVIESSWLTEPFEPIIIDGRMYARGAQDNKGQLCYVLCALESLIKEGKLNYNVKIFIDGEEECGSENTANVLESIKDDLKSDYLLACDTGAVSEKIGGIVVGLRGIMSMDVKLMGANSGFHSGTFGGVLKNPAVELCRLIGTLHLEDGRVAVDGFYDGVLDLKDIPYDKISKFDNKKCFEITGVYPTGGETYITNANVRSGLRPTLDILYLQAGASNEKDITNSIPPFAKAKISCRLVGEQDPRDVFLKVKEHLEKHNKSGLKLEIIGEGSGASSFVMSTKSDGIQKALEVLNVLCEDVKYWYEGGSIPIIAKFAKYVKNAPILVGFGLDEDNIHADNESFSIEQFRKGFLFSYVFLGS